MSLELFESKRGRACELLLSIDDQQYKDILNVFELYRSKSGIIIDEFTDTKINSGFAGLIDAVREIIATNKNNLDILNDLLNALEKAESENKNIVFLGE